MSSLRDEAAADATDNTFLTLNIVSVMLALCILLRYLFGVCLGNFRFGRMLGATFTRCSMILYVMGLICALNCVIRVLAILLMTAYAYFN